MSHYDYTWSQNDELAVGPFYGLIMAAMRRADTNNLEKLQRAWPWVWAELSERYNAPGGYLPDEAPPVCSVCGETGHYECGNE